MATDTAAAPAKKRTRAPSKRPQASSVEAAIQAAVAAAEGLPRPPAHVKMRPGDWPFWDGIVRARARDEWTGPHLVVAAQLARCQHDIENESALLDGEKTVTSNCRGTPVVNPRVMVLEQFARREMALMRSLAIAGRAVVDPRKLEATRKLQRRADEAQDAIAGEDDDDFLAK